MSEGSRRIGRSRETWGPVLIVAVAAGVVVAFALMLWSNSAVDRAQPDVAPPASKSEPPKAALEDAEPSPSRELPADAPEGAAVARAGLDLLGRERPLDPADLDEMLNRALDVEAALGARIRAVRWLGRFGSDEAIDVLEHVLRAGSPALLMTETAEALGSSENADARRSIQRLVTGNAIPSPPLGV